MNSRLMTHEELKEAYREKVIISEKLERYFILTRVGCVNEEEKAELEKLTIEITNFMVLGVKLT